MFIHRRHDSAGGKSYRSTQKPLGLINEFRKLAGYKTRSIEGLPILGLDRVDTLLPVLPTKYSLKPWILYMKHT